MCVLLCAGRVNKYNSEFSASHGGGGYGRGYVAEPEWFTEGPVSQSDTIELRGFDTVTHNDRPRTRHASSGSDADDTEPARQRDRVDGGRVKKNKESCLSDGGGRDGIDATSDCAVLNDGRHQETTDHGQ